MENTIIAIDGPAGSGKSTIAKILAKRLGSVYIDTGAMYRALAYKTLILGVDVESEKDVVDVLLSSDIDFSEGKTLLDGKDVSEQIRMPRVSEIVSQIASIKQVRVVMVELQRRIAGRHDVVMDGRDIGTHVFPSAQHKFFMVADISERARRRHAEMIEKGYELELSDVVEDLSERDNKDKSREYAPLAKAEDAILIDTTQKDIKQVTNEILEHIQRGDNCEN